jgi:hypothetical protein
VTRTVLDVLIGIAGLAEDEGFYLLNHAAEKVAKERGQGSLLGVSSGMSPHCHAFAHIASLLQLRMSALSSSSTFMVILRPP